MHILQSDIDAISGAPDYFDRILLAAQMYVSVGIPVLPVRPNTKAIPNGMTFNSSARTAEKVARWFGPGGKYRGFGISIPTGPNSVMVIDLDKRDDKDGIKAFRDLTGMDPMSIAPRSITPSGGLHLFYHWFSGADTNVGKIAPGIDIRGGRDNGCTGHALVWPTILHGVEYRWGEAGVIMAAPDEVRSLVLKITSLPVAVGGGTRRLPPSVAPGGRGNEHIVEEDRLTEAQLRGLVANIDPNMLEYDEWLKVGMAIRTYLPGEEGLRLFDEWSQRGERYSPGECSGRWEGFRTGGEVRQGTLRMYAAACSEGERPAEYVANKSTEISTADERISQIVDEMNKKYAVVNLGNKVRVMVYRNSMDRFKPAFGLLTRADFMTLTEYLKLTVPHGRGYKEMLQAEIWMSDPRRKDYHNGITMAPGKPREFDGHYNLWEGFTVEPKEGEWDLFKTHIWDVVCSQNQEIFDWVLDWMAHGVQRPADLPGTAIVMRGGEGTGKGTFANLYGELFGVHYKHLTHSSHLVGNFNSHLADAVVVFADEVVYGGDRRTAGVLKALVTESRMVVEQKGVDAIQVPNCTHLIIASNESWVVPAGSTARRWLCLDVNSSRAQDTEYFSRIYKQMENGGMAGMLHELLQRKITNNVRIAPDTKMRAEQKMMYARMDTISEWWGQTLLSGRIRVPLLTRTTDAENDTIDESGWPQFRRVLAMEMFGLYERWCLERRRPVEQATIFANVMINKLGMRRKKSHGLRSWEFVTIEEHISAYEKHVGHPLDITESESDEEERDNEEA